MEKSGRRHRHDRQEKGRHAEEDHPDPVLWIHLGGEEERNTDNDGKEDQA